MIGRRVIGVLSGGAFLFGMAGWTSLPAAEPGVELVSLTREVPERGRLQAAAMVRGGERSSFIVPAGWRIGLETKSGAVVLQSVENNGLIEIRRMPLPEKGTNIKQLRDQLSDPAQTQKTGEEYAWAGAPCRAQVFDSVEASNNNLKLKRRTCLMMREDHVLVVTLTAQESSFPSCVRGYEIVLASLRQE